MKNLFANACLFLLSSAALSEPCMGFQEEELIQCLQEQIKTHKPEPLSYVDFNNLLANHRISQEKADGLINFAYSSDIANPILFREAKDEVTPEQYSLNFLWIHEQRLTEKGHLMGANDKNLKSKVLSPLIDWSNKQPEANINFWYDGDMVGSENVEDTKKIISSIAQLDGKKIRFRDIRDIPFVKLNPQLFSPKIPVFFRVDLAKAITADYVMRVERLPFAFNIDCDIIAVIRAQLFDEPTLYALKKIGYSFGSANGADEENSFIMLHNAKDLNLMSIHYDTVIERAKEMAKETSVLSPQDVFYLYSGFKTTMRMQFKERNNGQTWAKQDIRGNRGKAMIFPKSQFGALGGYEEKIISSLKNALAKNASKNTNMQRCPHCGY